MPIGMPVATKLERIASMLCFVLVIGQCAFLGLFGSYAAKDALQAQHRTKAAYQRIEELAELDELTGSFNRRCIMRMLERDRSRASQPTHLARSR